METHTDKQMDRQTNGKTNKWTHKQTDSKHTDEWTNKKLKRIKPIDVGTNRQHLFK